MNDFKVVIPARYASSRLPGKPLLPLAGKPMVLHVCDRARESGARDIVVATDHEDIRACVEAYGVSSLMTSSDHRNGTERLAEVCEVLDWKESDILVNLQGDEPLVPASMIRRLAAMLYETSDARVATLATSIDDPAELFDPNVCKVVVDLDRYALYFSRAPIPWDRDRFVPGRIPERLFSRYSRHVGMYAYSVAFLNRYKNWSPSDLEQIEMLEQLRILWHGERILVGMIEHPPQAGIDTPADLARVETILRRGWTRVE